MFQSRFLLSAVAAALLTLAFTSIAQAQLAQTFVSAQSGNDVNNCSLALPCRSFTRALTQVQAGGEVTALDSGDYAPFTINLPVTVQAAPGVDATITVVSGDGVQITAASPNVVVVRGLTFNGMGTASVGIHMIAGSQVQIEHCIINAFTLAGIRIAPNAAGQHSISHTVVRNSNLGILGAISLSNVGTVQFTVEGCRVEKSASHGISFVTNFANNKVLATVRDSIAAGGTTSGFQASASSGGNTEMNLENCVAANNSSGIKVLGAATTARVSNCTVTGNGTGLSGLLLSRGNNTVEGNTADGSFTGSFAVK